MKQKITHRFDAKHARNLGQQSVSNSIAAVFELVKNGYDADANSVEVIFSGTTDPVTKKIKFWKIRIRDDGVGMTYEDICDKWMVIGTDIKERETLSPLYQRRVVGSKGMGRFATQRLGSMVTVISEPFMYKNRKSKYPDDQIILRQDWTKYKPGLIFEEIEDELETVERPYKDSRGVEIQIEDLNDVWDEKDLERLKERLGLLVLPKQILKNNEHPFVATIVVEGLDIKTIPIESTLFKNAPFSINAKLRGGKIIYSIYERGVKIEKRPFDEPIPVEGLSCGDVDFIMYEYPQDKRDDPTKVWARYYNKFITADKFDRILDQYSGIKIYNDNVRVMPYGEPGNDWLNLNARRIKKFGASKITNRTVIGFVLLTRDKNSDIQETTTREALIENDAFRDLKLFIDKSISQFEYFREEKKKEEKEEETIVNPVNIARLEIKELQDEISYLDLKKEDHEKIHNKLTKVRKNLDLLEEKYEDEIEESSRTEEVYRNLASVGLTTISFNHEIAAPLLSMDGFADNLLEDMYDKSLSEEERKDMLLANKRNISTMLHWANYMRGFTSLISASKGKLKKAHFSVEETVKNLLQAYAMVMEEQEVKIRQAYPGGTPNLFMNKADFESILTNLLTNSVKSLKQVNHEREIRIESWQTLSHFKLKFTDNGTGVRKEDFQRIFEPFYTTYKDPHKGIQGTGLGLTIISEILENYDGILTLDWSEWNKGATFLVTIPLENVTRK